MRTVAVVQARMGSTRRPGKVMADIGGTPALALMLERATGAPGVDELVVATSELERDDVIERLCASSGVACVRGSEADVLDRFHVAARRFDAGVVVRMMADCPLIDREVVGQLVALRAERGYGWAAVASGAAPAELGLRRFPHGLDAEIFTAAALESAWSESTDPADREHVTLFMGRDERLSRGHLEADEDHGGERWTVDHPADLELVRAIVARIGRRAGYREIIALLDREPELRRINAQYAT